MHQPNHFTSHVINYVTDYFIINIVIYYSISIHNWSKSLSLNRLPYHYLFPVIIYSSYYYFLLFVYFFHPLAAYSSLGQHSNGIAFQYVQRWSTGFQVNPLDYTGIFISKNILFHTASHEICLSTLRIVCFFCCILFFYFHFSLFISFTRYIYFCYFYFIELYFITFLICSTVLHELQHFICWTMVISNN